MSSEQHHEEQEQQDPVEQVARLLAQSPEDLADLVAQSLTSDERSEVAKALQRRRKRRFRLLRGGGVVVVGACGAVKHALSTQLSQALVASAAAAVAAGVMVPPPTPEPSKPRRDEPHSQVMPMLADNFKMPSVHAVAESTKSSKAVTSPHYATAGEDRASDAADAALVKANARAKVDVGVARVDSTSSLRLGGILAETKADRDRPLVHLVQNTVAHVPVVKRVQIRDELRAGIRRAARRESEWRERSGGSDSGLPLQIGEQVSVDVDRGLDRLVPQTLLDGD